MDRHLSLSPSQIAKLHSPRHLRPHGYHNHSLAFYCPISCSLCFPTSPPNDNSLTGPSDICISKHNMPLFHCPLSNPFPLRHAREQGAGNFFVIPLLLCCYSWRMYKLLSHTIICFIAYICWPRQGNVTTLTSSSVWRNVSLNSFAVVQLVGSLGDF